MIPRAAPAAACGAMVGPPSQGGAGSAAAAFRDNAAAGCNGRTFRAPAGPLPARPGAGFAVRGLLRAGRTVGTAPRPGRRP